MSFKSDMEKLNKSDPFHTVKLCGYHLARDDDAEIIMSSIPENAKSIYDPMCGTGSLLVLCRKRGMRVTAADENMSAVMLCKARLSSEIFTADDTEQLLAAKPKHGYLSHLSSSKYPTSYFSRNYIDGLVSGAWEHPRKDLALGIMSGVLMTMCGNFGAFKQTLDPYPLKGIKTLVRRIVQYINAHEYSEDAPKALVFHDDIRKLKIPKADVIFIDPPLSDSKYSERYRNVNSVLMQKTMEMVEHKGGILGMLEEYSKQCKTLIVASDINCSDHLRNKRYVASRKLSMTLWTASDTEMRLYEPLANVSSIEKYDPFRARTEAEIKMLLDDLRLCEYWYSTIISGGTIQHSLEAVERSAVNILLCLGSCGFKAETGNQFIGKVAGKMRNGVELFTESGLVFDSDDIAAITEYRKKSFIRGNDLSAFVGRTLYLCDTEKSYGIIRLNSGVENKYTLSAVKVFNAPRKLISEAKNGFIQQVRFSGNIDFDEVPKRISIAELSVVDLVSLHDDLHEYYNKSLPRDWAPADVVSIHEHVLMEMTRRNIQHEQSDILDKSGTTITSTMKVRDVIGAIDAAFPKTIKVENIRCITGALAEKLGLVEMEAPFGANSVELFDSADGTIPALDTELDINIRNVCGKQPYGKYIPLYDAVFVRRDKLEAVEPEYMLGRWKYIRPCVPRICEMTLLELASIYGGKPLSVEPRMYGLRLIVDTYHASAYDSSAERVELSAELREQLKSLAERLMLDGFLHSDGTFTVCSILRYNSTELAYKVDLEVEHGIFFPLLRDTELIRRNEFIHTDTEMQLREALETIKGPAVIKHRKSIYYPNETHNSWLEFCSNNWAAKPAHKFTEMKDVYSFFSI